MSDAMNPSHSLPDESAQSSAASEPIAVGESLPETTGDGWQTVDFPGAIQVDAIPLDIPPQEPTGVESANLFDHEGSPAVLDSTPVIHQLQQENAALRIQIAQLEEDLSQAQIELQLEMARFYCKEADAEVVFQAHDQEAIAQAQVQIQELTEALQVAQQTLAQQQAALAQQRASIETLTGQLDHSQQRIAQLERDCALSQQRYNEQLQLVSQAENTCQDLRMRLHRQQQQTLQFKAALEKSIEMHGVVDPHQTEPDAIADAEATDHDSEQTTAFIPKARPVQPWSTAPRMTPHVHTHAKSGSGLPNLLAKLAKQPLTSPSPAAVEPPVSAPVAAPFSSDVPADPAPSTPAIDESSKQILEFLFPPQPAAPIAHPPVPPAPIFDLSPFIEAGEVESNHISATTDEAIPVEPMGLSPEPATEPPLPKSQPVGLWADLARLIEPDLVEAEDLATPVNSDAAPIDTNAIVMPAETEAPAVAQPHDLNWSATPISLASFNAARATPTEPPTPEDAAVVAHNPFPSFTLQSTDPSRQDAIAAEPNIAIHDPTEASVAMNSPSPILYPMRQPKKIPSMAAVDLPSFPRG